MRRWWVGVVAVVVVALGVWWWLREDAPAPAEEVSPAAAANEGGLPAVLQASKWSAPIVQRGARAVSGVVLRDGRPVSGAVVTAIASHGDDVLSDLPCQCDNHCGQKLLACGCAEASGQLVELVGARTGEGTPLGRATTDAEGVFSITGLDETKLTLWADAPGGVAWKSEVPSDAADVRLALLPGRFLKGSVKKTDGSPAAGALVTAIFAEQSRFFDVVADARGGFRVGPLPRGKYAVVGMQSGLLPDHQTVGENAGDEVSLELSIPRSLSGTVVREGAPVPGVTVKLEGMHRKRTVITDAQGAFHLERLRPGSYELDAEIGAELTHATAVVSKHEDRAGVVLTLQRGVSLSGLVTDPRGAALSEVQLSLLDHEAWRRATSDATGHFRFPVASEGAHQLSASRRGSLTWSEEVKGPEVRITLKDSSVLSGRVVDGAGQLVPRFTISASLQRDGGAAAMGEDFDFGAGDDPGAGMADSESSTDGGFALDLVPGRFEVWVEAAPFAPLRLEATAPGDVVIALKMGAKVRGQVVDLDGVPAPGVQVNSRAEGRERRSERASTDAEGHFLLEGMEAGRHTLTAVQKEDGLRTWTAQAVVTLAEGATAEVVLRPNAGVAVAGVVLSDRGEPAPEVTVTGWAESKDGGVEPAGASMARTDSEGRFRLRTLPAGGLTLMAQPKNGPTTTSRVLVPDEHLVLRLKSATTVSGRVVDEQGKPIKSFSLLGVPIDSEDGRFERPARPGKDTLAIDAEGFAQHIFEVDLKPGPNDVGDVTLSRGRPLTGVVTDAQTHQPVEGALLDVGASEPKGTVFLSERNGAVRTDAEGHYRFASVDPTSSWISVTHPSYVTTHKPLAPFMTSLDLALGSGGTLTVKVMDALGQPVRESRVMASSNVEWKPFAPTAPGVFTAAGLAPGPWQVRVQVRSQAKYRPLEVEVKAGPQEVVAREATDGVTVKFDVAGGSQFMLLNEGSIATPTNRNELEGLRSAEPVTGAVARNVIPGTWTLILMRQQGQGQEIASHTFQVTAHGDQEVKVTPQWRAISFE